MESITHIKDNINAFSNNSFVFSSYIEPLFLLKNIPDSISYELNDMDFVYHLGEANSHISKLNSIFEEKINPLLKKELPKLKKSPNKDRTIPYADFKVDEPPKFKKISYKQVSFEDLRESNPRIKPIKRRSEFNFDGVCPRCGAPKEYIYDNNGGKGQFKCRACHLVFSTKTTQPNELELLCPHCERKLQIHHDRSQYIVYRCDNTQCSYYLRNKELAKKNDPSLKTSSGRDRLRYHYRDFKFNIDELKAITSKIPTKVNLSKIHRSHRVLGLVLTYYVNYGLSSRKTALILNQVHGIKISHQTVVNYATSVASIVKPMVDYYPYELTNTLCGDETYIKIRGKNHYVFFWSDPTKKTITSYTIYPVRDTKCACISILDCLKHYQKIPPDLLLIVDGNPIYNAAQLFFHLHDINFQLRQVIGVKNKDDTSAQYRPFKQIEERLNRTYKQNYHGTNGYDTLDGANNYMVLFVCFFNFLREHSSLDYKTPVKLDCFEDDMLMQDRWLKLINLSFQYHQKA